MRTLALAAVVAAFVTTSGAAFADPVSLAPVSVAPDLREDFSEKYGDRELEYLEKRLERSLTREFAANGASVASDAPVRFEVTLEKAEPSKPTFKQLGDKPGLDYTRSASLGGASLSGRFVDASGAVLAEVKHEQRAYSLFDPEPISTWDETTRALSRFADKAGRTYAKDVKP